MLTEAQTTKPATDALTDLVDTARKRARAARKRARAARNQRQNKRADALENVAYTLDAARTRLVQDGIEYLDAAWAFVDGGRNIIANLEVSRHIRGAA